jgi:hypothetical protein
MSTSFQNKIEILDFKVGAGLGLVISLLFITAAYYICLHSLISDALLNYITAGWFLIWGIMHDLRKEDERNIAMGHLFAQSIIVFLGMLICFSIYKSLWLCGLSAFGFCLGCATYTSWKWLSSQTGLCED